MGGYCVDQVRGVGFRPSPNLSSVRLELHGYRRADMTK